MAMNKIIIDEQSELFKSLLKKNLFECYKSNPEGYKDFEKYYKYKSDFLIEAYKNKSQ